MPREAPVTRTDCGVTFGCRAGAPSRQRPVGGRGARDLLPARPRVRLAGALLGLRRGMPEPVEQLHLLDAVAAHRALLRQALDQLLDARADLVGEVGCRRPDEGVDLLDRRHAGKPTGYSKRSMSVPIRLRPTGSARDDAPLS